MWFTSDNAGPAAPPVMAAMLQANEGYAGSYGADPIMESVRHKVRALFEAPDAAVYLTATGTSANSLALATLVQPWSSIYCSTNAHIEWDECGAPEFFTGGAKLVLIDGENGTIDPDRLSARLAEGTQSDVHQVQRGALSLTNATELGAVYSVAEVARLASIAKAYGLPVHMDGARFANAIAATGASPAEMTWKSGVDALSFGGTKNGLLGVEGVIFFDPKKAWEFELRRKRAGHLFSKHRFLSAQMDAYLTDDLWLELARNANARAAQLVDGLRARGRSVLYRPDANMVFAQWDRATHERLMAGGAHYYFWPHTAADDGPDDEVVACRLVANWSTSEQDVADFQGLLD